MPLKVCLLPLLKGEDTKARGPDLSSKLNSKEVQEPALTLAKQGFPIPSEDARSGRGCKELPSYTSPKATHNTEKQSRAFSTLAPEQEANRKTRRVGSTGRPVLRYHECFHPRNKAPAI